MLVCAICLHAAGLNPLRDRLGPWAGARCARCRGLDCCYRVAVLPAPIPLAQGEPR